MNAILISLVLACGVERWDVKTLADDAGDSIHFEWRAPATVEFLASIPAPASWTLSTPRLPEETKAYVVLASVTGYKLEEDGDYHVVIRGDGGSTMIVELPDPGCVPDERRTQAYKVRQDFLALVKRAPTPKFRALVRPIPVRVTGVLFFDKLHGQTGAAPNGAELHPVVSVAPR